MPHLLCMSCDSCATPFPADVVECMACSDNVVRAGLTVKYRDKETLCQMLTYNMDTPDKNKFSPKPHPKTPCVQVYDPPTPEFTVARISIPAGVKELELPPVQGNSVHCGCMHVCFIICNRLSRLFRKHDFMS